MTYKCTPNLHVFHWAEDHPYNKPASIGGNCRGFPYGHTCLCGEKVKEEPKLDTTIRKGTMIHKILGDNPIANHT